MRGPLGPRTDQSPAAARIGWPDKFIEHASTVDYLREKHGLTAENAVAKVKAQFNAAPMMPASSEQPKPKLA